jgi:hypothetical protein
VAFRPKRTNTLSPGGAAQAARLLLKLTGATPLRKLEKRGIAGAISPSRFSYVTFTFFPLSHQMTRA